MPRTESNVEWTAEQDERGLWFVKSARQGVTIDITVDSWTKDEQEARDLAETLNRLGALVGEIAK